MSGSWADSWNGYALVFDLTGGQLRRQGTTPILFTATDADGNLAADGYFRHRAEGFEDRQLRRWFDVVVLSSLDIKEGHKRVGLGTEIVRSLARQFPGALIVGENANDDAQAWHKERLEKLFPTRMLDVTQGGDVRVRPGAELDSSEIG
ncbi:MAG: hypothetical protein J0J04_07740 [Microbacterium sp.]|uniref:hypothetical protein n=1 Tax=Microbacterium sp. TaxID=51671 RepID=UPI001ACEC910|nr:hypothetical protein [Microbacterium sp.]MBN9214690.1 hypothetical protein [Microbacterium sp.]